MMTQELLELNESARHISLWRGEFADNYVKYPKLYRALTENELYVCMDEDVLKICFYLKHDIQKRWVEERFYDSFIMNLRLLFGVEAIELEIIAGMDLPF